MGKNFAIMHIEKIKKPGTLVSRYKHDYRIADVSNADKNAQQMNETLIAMQKGQNYYEAQRERINELEYYKDHKVRKNAVLAYDVIMSYSSGSGVDVDEWKKASVQWLQDTFNKAGDGKNNVISAVLHMDEIHDDPEKEGDDVHNAPHIHAIVVPVDDRGRLNASYYTDGVRALSQLQDTYAQAMKELGLQRGVRNSSARHEDMRKMYGRFNEAMENIPQPKQGETAQEYYERARSDIQTANVRAMRSADDYFRDMRRRNDAGLQVQMDEVDIHFHQKEKQLEKQMKDMEKKLDEKEKEIERKHKSLRKDIKEAHEKKDQIKQEYQELQTQLEEIRSRIQQLSFADSETLDEMEEDLIYMDNLRAGLERLRDEDSRLADEYEEAISYVQSKGEKSREAEIEIEEER